MKNTKVVYWSGTGNTEKMAQEFANALGVDAVFVNDISASEANEAEVLVLGCPAMGAEELESGEFEPFYNDLDLDGKKVVLFGSYDWGDGSWLEIWKENAEGRGAEVLATIKANLDPSDEAFGEINEVADQVAGL